MFLKVQINERIYIFPIFYIYSIIFISFLFIYIYIYIFMKKFLLLFKIVNKIINISCKMNRRSPLK